MQDANGATLATYGALAQAASGITLSSAAPLLSAGGNYKVVGQRLKRPDVALKVNGRAIFGLDVQASTSFFSMMRDIAAAWGRADPVIADGNNGRIRQVAPDGTISTWAGRGREPKVY